MSETEQEQKRLGTGMFIVGWLGFLALIGFWFSDLLEEQRNPNQALSTQYSDGAREVLLQRNRFGHYVTSGKINGEDVTFMLDTGATTIAVPSHIASALDLSLGQRFMTQTANGTAAAYATRLDTVSIDGIVLENVEAAVTPGLKSEEILLGMSFLRNIEFTQRGDTLLLRQYAPPPDR